MEYQINSGQERGAGAAEPERLGDLLSEKQELERHIEKLEKLSVDGWGLADAMRKVVEEQKAVLVRNYSARIAEIDAELGKPAQ